MEALHDVSLAAAALHNEEGLIQSQSALNIQAQGTVDNTQGALVANGAMEIHAGDIDNTLGIVAAGGNAEVRANNINNSQGAIASDQRLKIDSAAINNHQGHLQARATLNLDTQGHQLTNTQGVLVAGGDLLVASGGINNTQGTLAAQQDATLVSAALNNDMGLFQAAGTLDINTQGQTLTNTNASAHDTGSGGLVAGVAAVLTTGAMDNTDGALLSAGTLDISATGALTNLRGRLQAVGDSRIDTHGTNLDNTAGRIASQGTLTLNTGELANDVQGAQAGLIGSQGNLTIEATAISNGAVGTVQSNIWSAQSANLSATSFTNAGVLSGSDVSLTSTSDVTNNAGASIESSGNLSITAAATVINAGQLIANDQLHVAAHAFGNRGSMEATHHNLFVSDKFSNLAGASITASHSVDIDANTFSNWGVVNANSADGASRVHIRANTGNNTSTGAIFGDSIAISATTLNNRPSEIGGTSPVIAAREQMDIGVQTLNNEDGALLYSGGSMAIGGSLDADRQAMGQAQTINNLSAEMEATDQLRISTGVLTNSRRNVSIDAVEVLNQSNVLNMPSWWVNGQNAYGNAIEATSNYTPHLFYLLDPASILSDTQVVTPDGNFIRRVEIALDPSDSVFHAAIGAYAAWYGVRERVTAGAPSTVVLFAQGRLDGVTNPDQVSGTPDVFAGYTTTVSQWQRNTLSYSDTYGRCTNNCTMLVVQPGYTDPQSIILRDTQRYLTGTHPGLEVSRTAHQTVVEDQLNADAGAAASIRAGGDMHLDVATSLTNRFADIQAGANLDLQASSATVINEGQTLKRTHRFLNTTHTAGQGSFNWTNPDISEVIGQIGGTLSGNQQLNITAKSLSNTDLARSSGLPTSGLGFLGVTLPTASAPITLPGNALFQPSNPGSNHLIQGAPSFTGYREWLGSAYLIANLGADPNALQKRLGDGFYEQKMIREQVAQLTGRRFLDGHSNDEAQYRALMDSGVTYAQQWNLVPGVALTAEQMAQLTTDLVWLVEREVVLPDGRKTTALVPQVYVRQVPEGDFRASGALVAGNNISLQVMDDLVNAGGRVEGDAVMAQAGRDLNNIGGLMQARSELLASAGRHVTISSPTHSTSFAGQYVNQSRTELAGIGEMRVGQSAGAKLSIEAGGNVALQAASVGNASTSGSTRIQAGGNVELQTAQVGSSDNTEFDARNYQRNSQRSEIGTRVQGAGDIHIEAGNDVTARAASVNAGADLSVKAGKDITLEAGRSASASASSTYTKRSGFLSKKSNEEVKSSTSDVALGSSFSGANVMLEADQDIAVKGSGVNAQDLLLIDGGRDVAITSEQNTESGRYFKETRKSGISVDVMDGVSYGKSRQNANQTYESATQSASSVTGGDVTVQAGRDAVVRSSVVIADKDLTVIAGRDVRVEAATDTLTSTNDAYAKSTTIGIEAGASGRFTAFGQTRSTQDGTSISETAAQSLLSANAGSLTVIAGTDSQHQGTGSGNVDTQGGTLLAKDTVALSGNSVTLGTADSRSDNEFHAQSKSFTIGSQLTGVVGGLITQAGDAVQAARNTDNDRLQAAAALKAGYDAYKLAGTTGASITASAGTAAQPGDPGAAGIGISASIGSSRSRQDEKQTTTQQAGTVIQAGQIDIQAREGDLKATGAKLQAQDIALQAKGDIDLQAAKNTAELHSTNSGGSAGVGVTFGLGEQSGISFQLSASRSKGNGDGSETTHDNTVVTATNTLTVRSGADTNLRGAQLAGETVIADVGGDLNIQTQQDTSQYESQQKSSGLSVSVCVPPICYGNMVTGSISMSKEQIDHDFESANAQSGIAAGSGGFDIAVAGNTDLQGAAITSTAEQDKNRLSTGSLTYNDLTNTQTTRAESESMSLGYGGGSAIATVAANVVGNVLANEMGERGLPENVTQTSTTQSVISPATITVTGSDETRAQSEENVATLTARDASTANEALTNQLTLQQAQALKAEQERNRENQIAANYVGAVITNVIGDVAQSQGWPDGGWQKTALHGLAGLIQAKVAGTDPGKAMVAAMLNEQMLPVLEEYLESQGITATDPETKAEFKALMEAGSALLGAVFDAAHIAHTATVNNYLKHIDVQKLEEKLKDCGDNAACRERAFDEAYRTSLANDIELLNCQSTSNCDVLKAEYRRGYAAIEDLMDKGIKPADVSLILGMETNAQTIIRKGLDQLHCTSAACVEKANYLVGVGKGLAKVTPAGLVTGSGVMAYELTTALLNFGLTDTAIALTQGVAGLPAELRHRLTSDDPQVRGEALVDVLAIGTVATVVTTKLTQTGYGAAMRRVEAKALAAKEAETIAARMREVAIHVDDARFSQVAQEIVAAEKAGWKTADGKPWWPPENGKVPGTDQIVELKVGQRLDRYGGTSDRSTFLAPADTPLGQRALPESTNLAVRDEYIVRQPFKVEESRVMPWFGKQGMGIQYETSKGAEKTIQKLIEDGVLERVSP